VPWQGFQYITERLMDSALVDTEVLFWILFLFNHG
jgi:hypothetical protein